MGDAGQERSQTLRTQILPVLTKGKLAGIGRGMGEVKTPMGLAWQEFLFHKEMDKQAIQKNKTEKPTQPPSHSCLFSGAAGTFLDSCKEYFYVSDKPATKPLSP